MRIAAALVFVIVQLAGPAAAQPQGQGAATFTILHFNDVYEITAVEGGKAGGLARVASESERRR